MTLQVPLSATSTGSTLYCPELTGHTELDLGHQHTGPPFQKRLLLTNYGRKTATVQWINVTLEATKKELGRAMRNANGKPDVSLIPEDRRAAFSVSPETGSLAPGEAMEVVVTGGATKTRALRERLQLLSSTSNVRAWPVTCCLPLLCVPFFFGCRSVFTNLFSAVFR